MSDKVMRKERNHRAFTLVELLVVIAIIAMLIAVIVPGFRGVMAMARQMQCANNLHHIGVAVRNAQADGQLKGHGDGFFVSGWGGQLAEHLEEEVFICPEDDPKAVGLTWPVAIHSWADYNTDDYIQEFETGIFMRKLSDEQYQAAGLHDGKTVVNLPAYEPGSNPSLYWYVMEDWHYGHYELGYCDFDWDVHTKVTESGTGWITLLLKQMGSGYQFELIELATNDVLMTKAQMTGIAPGAEYGFGGGRLSSYGLNEGLSPIRHSVGKKILALDYESHIVQPDSDLWTDGVWDEDNNGILDFARHNGAINVLFMDGSVEAKSPEQIDPYYPTIRNTYWVRGQ